MVGGRRAMHDLVLARFIIGLAPSDHQHLLSGNRFDGGAWLTRWPVKFNETSDG